MPDHTVGQPLDTMSRGRSSVWPNERVVPTSLAPRRRRVVVPLLLFVATCASTYLLGGLAFCLALMFTLTAHELGHYIQARRYGVPASLPYFIPMPFSPIGTMGAVIAMRGGMGNRKSLFDIGITGPLAGLIPAVAFCVIGLRLSDVGQVAQGTPTLMLGEPLMFKALTYLMFGPLPSGMDVFLHPIAYAGWVGIFITALNLIPIGQLDGGHVLYALLRGKARFFSTTLLLAAVVAMAIWSLWGWSLMVLLLLLFGPNHPPTADDATELGLGRTILGYVTLLFVFAGFTPTPFLG